MRFKKCRGSGAGEECVECAEDTNCWTNSRYGAHSPWFIDVDASSDANPWTKYRAEIFVECPMGKNSQVTVSFSVHVPKKVVNGKVQIYVTGTLAKTMDQPSTWTRTMPEGRQSVFVDFVPDDPTI